MMTRQRIVEEAQSWLGTPYHHMACVKGAGVDCAQILIAVYSDVLALDKPDVGHYPADWMLHRSEERYLWWLLKYCEETDVPLPGDIAVFKFGRCFSHAGIVINWPEIIHAHMQSKGVCLADATKGDLEGRDMKFYSIKGLA